MDKMQAARIIMDAASAYEKYLNNKNLLIIYDAPNKPMYIETYANSTNFHHLTGVKLNNQKLLEDVKNKNSNILTIFYSKALKQRLSPDAFEFKDNTTEQKLNVLTQTLRISSNTKMIGNYSGSRINFKTDKVAGNVHSFLGLVKDGKYYVPNTVMADDIRNNSTPFRILAVISKKINEPQYNKIISVAKNIDVHKLLQKISNSVSIDASLITPVAKKQTIAEVTKEVDKPIVTSTLTKAPAPQPVPQKQSLKAMMSKAAQQKKDMPILQC